MLHRLHQVVSRGIRCVADIDKRQRLDRLQEGLRIDYDNLANGGIVAIVFYPCNFLAASLLILIFDG